MARIIVDPNKLRDLGYAFRRESTNLEGMESRLNSAIYQLDWQIRARYPVERDWYAARGSLRSVRHQGDYLYSYLAHKADQFERADRRGYRGLRTRGRGRGFPAALNFAAYPILKLINDKDDSRMFCTFPIGLEGPVFVGLVGLLDSLVHDQGARGHALGLCLEAIDKLKPGISSLPVIGFVAGTFMDYVEGGDYSERGLRVAAGKNAIELAISANPYGKAALLISGGVQLGGTSAIRGFEWIGQRYSVDPMHDRMIGESADRAQYALEKLDLGNITGDLSAVANDIYVEPQIDAWQRAWREPSFSNIGKAFATSATVMNPSTYIIPAMSNPETRSMLGRDLRSLGGHVGDFVVGAYEVPGEMMRHTATVTGTMQSEFYSRTLPPSISQPLVDFNNSALQNMNSGNAIPKFEEMWQ